MSWEVQFRKAESELELKLSSFQNLSPENDSVKLESEIEQLLIRLNKIMNDQEGQNPKMTVALSHKISRNRDILMDYENQLKRTKEKHSQNKNRFDLMGSVRNDISQFHSQNQSKLNMMSNENDKLKSSHKLADTAINIAMSTQEQLRFQRGLYKGINRRFLELSTKFPIMNTLINKISLRKRRDSLIMGVVVSVCLILILIYSLR